jgi:hypothetical protein
MLVGMFGIVKLAGKFNAASFKDRKDRTYWLHDSLQQRFFIFWNLKLYVLYWRIYIKSLMYNSLRISQ